jgi:pantoate--beta-alanine ligase
MKVIRTIRGLIAWRRALSREGVRVGMVPTMGALHDGHRTLIRIARLACDALIVSVFVNPRQFGPTEDFARYPRRLRADAVLCRAEGADVVFAPSLAEMYPPGHQTAVSVREVARRWEGEARPHHFDGVATVVTKLLSAAMPDVAFFGQKDYQQAVLIRRLVTDLNLGVTVRVCPTVREPDGLALSSRNEYLTPAQRRAAPILYQALQVGKAAITQGERSGAAVRRRMRAVVASEPMVTIEYLAVCDPQTLEPLARVMKRAVLLGAIRLGRVRLIDNVLAGR